MNDNDLLIITADHGNDPTHHGTDHTREFVPLICYNPKMTSFKHIELRKTFADVGMTITDNFKTQNPQNGTSFLKALKEISHDN